MPSEAPSTDPQEALASLADLRAKSDILGRHNAQMLAVRGCPPSTYDGELMLSRNIVLENCVAGRTSVREENITG